MTGTMFLANVGPQCSSPHILNCNVTDAALARSESHNAIVLRSLASTDSVIPKNFAPYCTAGLPAARMTFPILAFHVLSRMKRCLRFSNVFMRTLPCL